MQVYTHPFPPLSFQILYIINVYKCFFPLQIVHNNMFDIHSYMMHKNMPKVKTVALFAVGDIVLAWFGPICPYDIGHIFRA